MRSIRIAALVCSIAFYSLPAHAAGIAHLSGIKGDVEILPHSQTQWHVAREGEAMDAGDAVKTGPQSSATLDRNDGSAVELLPFAQLTIADEQGFTLQAGQLWSHFMHAIKAPFYIRTPNATALIRGTTLSVSFQGDRSRVVVYEGLVEVHDKATGMQDVPGGFRVDVDNAGRLQRMEQAEQRELDEGRTFRMRHGLEGALSPQGRMGRGLPGHGEHGEQGRGEPGREEAHRETVPAHMMERMERIEEHAAHEQHLSPALELREEMSERRQQRAENAQRRPNRLPTQGQVSVPQQTTDDRRLIDRQVLPTRDVDPAQRIDTGLGVVGR